MIILLGFAVLAGAGTALSPCVLPVLPALLAAGGVGGRRRPLGIVLGLSITFTVTIVGLAMVVDGVGLGSDPLRVVSVVVLLVFGLALLAPGLAARIEAPLSRLARFGPRSAGDGFRSGLVVGAALGFSGLVVTRYGLGWFVLSFGIVTGVMMFSYVALPSRLLGLQPGMSRRDKLARNFLAGIHLACAIIRSN